MEIIKIISFKQFLIESKSIDAELRSRGLKRGGMGYKVGKVIGGEIYVHKQYEDQFPSVPLQNAKNALPKDFDYQVVKYNPKTGVFSFIKSSDFDSNPEPSVNGGITVKPDGTAKEFKDAGWIYHHKWQWVVGQEDIDNYPQVYGDFKPYTGFDVEKEKKRSLKWTGIEGLEKSKIGQRKYWDQNVIQRHGINDA